MRITRALVTIVFVGAFLYSAIGSGIGKNLPDPYENEIVTSAVTDTIPITDNYGDHITDPNTNPFDITSSVIEQKVEYDPLSGNYIIYEKIGDEYYRTPTVLTFAEYLEYKKKQQQRDYFNRLAGISSKKSSIGVKTDPMERIDIQNSLVDRLFGGTEVNIQPQGQVDVTLQSTYFDSFIPPIGGNSQNSAQFNPIDPDVDIRVSTEGNIGTKLNLDFNYDTQSTFDFDRQIKLEYDTEAFGEDDIIKKIEAGNVSLPLRGNLIQGAQSLFGLKTELQFGHLRLTGILSQQQSEQNNIRIENGSAVQEFELTPDQYDENRHFFLSHYNRETFESNLKNLPQIATSFRIAQLEVWVSQTVGNVAIGQNNTRNSQIVAIADMAEPELDKFSARDPMFRARYAPVVTDPIFTDVNGILLPDNRVNPVFDEFAVNEDMEFVGIEDQNEVQNILEKQGMRSATDFESFRGRKLRSNEYSFNEQLGMLSLNIRLRSDQILAVSYSYTYSANCDEVYTVGSLAGNGSQFAPRRTDPNNPDEEIVEAEKVIFTKLLKSATQPTNNPMYDLMMKNVYPLRASQLDPEEFVFDIFFEDDSDGSLKKFIPEDGLRNQPLLQVFNLDRLNKYNDPQPDGIFDFVPGVTIIPSSGSVVFPVLEPFGSSLRDLIGPAADKYIFQELYDTSATNAMQRLDKNKFILKGEVSSATSGEVNLGPFVPEGSVRVRAGGIQLQEGVDFEVDYSIGRLRIINDSYLQQGTPINVSFEDQAVFSLQQKTMTGLRADYEFSDNFSIGATYLKLSERPFTEKVNIGNDPINNRIYGLDLVYNNEAPFLTKMVDKLPFFSTKETSSINFTAEGAYLKPGHSGAININGQEDGGVVSIDDFEGAVSGLLLGGFNSNQWRLSSTPGDGRFPESEAFNDIVGGANRAKINWYTIDRQARNQGDFNNSYTRLIDQSELFNRDVQIGQSELITFDISYYPTERGPYNFDVPDGRTFNGAQISAGIERDENDDIRLKDPESRWGGIMRSFQNTDFEAANYEFIEFWMLNPYIERPDSIKHGDNETGKIIIQIGNVNEDILKDGQLFSENSMPIDGENEGSLRETDWGRVSNLLPITNVFDVEKGDQQDLGFDGMTDSLEQIKRSDYLETLRTANFRGDYLDDPSGDNYNFIESSASTASLLTRFKDFNNPQGNAPIGSATPDGLLRGNRYPESEDLNNNSSIEGDESYFEYELNIDRLIGTNELDKESASKYITQDTSINGEIWYRFRVPINLPDATLGQVNLRAIRFMRMYMTEFESAKTFRLAEFQLVRNLWRKSEVVCGNPEFSPGVKFSVDEVGVEENGRKSPFGYLSPADIKQERLFSTFSNLLQDEKSLALNFCDLADSCSIGINKLTRLDLTLYEKLQMFFHAEEEPMTNIKDGDLYGYIRFGKDLVNHYYEYEIPLEVTRDMTISTPQNIWPDTNKIDVKLDNFKKIKQLRIETGEPLNIEFKRPDPDRPDANITVKGTPGLGYIKVFEIGVRNSEEDSEVDFACGEVWVNELRATGLNEKGGLAAQARMQIQLADLGDVNLSANYSTIGFGALDQRLAERNREEILQYDAAINLQLGKFFPNNWGLNIPFYAQYSKDNAFQQFEPFERDLTVDEKIESLNVRKNSLTDPTEIEEIDDEIQSVKDRSKETTTIKTFNFTNVKKDGNGGKPWSISNFSTSYSYTETVKTDALIAEDKTNEYAATLDYNYSNRAKPIQPFKKIKSKALRIIKEFNFNPLPKSFTFSTNINRLTNTRRFRLPTTPVFQFDDKRFLWDRNYGLNWDFTKSLKFTFKARSSSLVDELRQTGIADTAEERDWQDERGNLVDEDGNQYTEQDAGDYRTQNLRNLGRNKNYNHNVSLQYTLPIRYLPYMDWIKVKGDYKADYGWTAGSLILIDDQTVNTPFDTGGTPLGNIIQNNQTRSANATFSFDKLYTKSGYLKKIEKGNKKSRRSRTRSTSSRRKNSKSTADGKDEKKKEDRKVTLAERILIRPLLSLRSVKATYKETFGTMLPGFMPESELLGLSNGFDAPGWGFVSGLQPNIEEWATDDTRKDWFNPSPNFSDQVSQNRTQNMDLRIALEPFKDFDIDIDFKKTYRNDKTSVFVNKEKSIAIVDGEEVEVPNLLNPSFSPQAEYEVGSFEYTNLGFNTLFMDSETLYRNFQERRKEVSFALASRDNSNGIPNALDAHSDEWEGEDPDNPDYYNGYGPNSYDVAVPAFLSTYLGEDFNINDTIGSKVSSLSFIPKPNWTVKYDGLSKLEMFKNIFTSFTINHAYKGGVQVSRFNTTLEYDNNLALNQAQDKSSVNDNYFSRIQIPVIAVSDQFAPLIGISLKTKNDFTFEAEWRKSRTLGLSLEDLREQKNSEFRIGVGYIIKNFRSNKKKKGKRRKKDQESEKDKSKKNGGLNGSGGVNNNRGKTLTMNFDFAITNSEDLIYEVSQGTSGVANGGQRTIQIAPSVDYDVNENLTMRFFFDYNYTESAVAVNSNRRLSMRGGVTAQLKIN